jgi:GNAT superfamily N-acetyltransferase
MTEVRLARADELDAVGAMLGRAFHDDALFVHMLPDDAERARLGPAHFTPFVRAAHAIGEVWVTGDLSAAACWVRPGSGGLTPAVAAAAGIDRIPDAVGADAWDRIGTVLGHFGVRAKALGVPVGWALTLIGVEPGRKGSGLGGQVIAPVLARADADGTPCYLDTLEARNVPFYERHGFHVIEDAVEPASGLRYWLMLRDPR